MNQEIERLEQTKKKYEEVIEDIKLTIRSLNNRQMMDSDALYALIKQYENKLRVIEEGLNKPYFARIDFEDDNHENKDVCYIGKVGVSDFDNQIITVDWRAPIASLYYDANLGQASYVAPEGIISGELQLKRQYEIENGKLISYNDVDTVSNDEILKPYLGVNADNRLKNIVSSIQEEQNKVIRKELSDNVIVQGVAGSGKTTVALHRIAYLAYNYREKIKSDQYMVIGPNKFFIQYISSVLPDLDVTDVPQLTFEEFVKEYLQEDFVIQDMGKISSSLNINKYKLSMQYKDNIDKFIKVVDQKMVVPKKDFDIKGFKLLPQAVINDIYQTVDEKIFPNIELKIERTVLMASTYLKERREEFLTSLLRQCNEKIGKAQSAKEKDKIRKDYDAVKRELLGTGCSTSLKKYFTFRNKKITTLYDEFIKDAKKYMDEDIAGVFKLATFKKKGTYSIEDLAGLLYLGYKIKNRKEFKKYRHTVIDEAQDYGELNFYVLKQVLSSSTFSIFGDLAQSIYDYRSIDNWEEVIRTSFNCDCDLEYLRKSYRTTVEIMNAANEVLNYIGLKTAQPVIRHGEDIKLIRIQHDFYNQLLVRIEELEKKKYDSIALISRDELSAHEVKEELEKLGVKISEIMPENQEYNGGLCSVSSSLAKGLEFDAVIITDASEKKYSSCDKTDMKNLYVSMTRPLHELEIFYQEEVTKPLQKCLTKNRN